MDNPIESRRSDNGARSRILGSDPRVAGTFVAALLLFALGALYILSLPDNHDNAWLLYASGRILGGAELYVDVVESNPPLIFFFAIAVKSLSNLIAVQDLFLFQAIVLGVIAAALGLFWTVLRRVVDDSLGGVAGVLLLVAVFLLVPFVGYHFGQREHLAIVLTLPYLVAVAGRADGVSLPTGLAVAIGVAGGLGFAIKPFFLLVWLAVEAYLFLFCSRSLWKRPEQLSVLGLFAVYALAAAIFTPAYFRLAVTAISVYGGYHSYGPDYIIRYWVTLFLLVVLLAHSNVESSRQLRQLRRTFSVAATAFWVVVLVQNKGWDYHWIHVKVVTILLLTLVAADALSHVVRGRLRPSLGWVPVGLVAVGLFAGSAVLYRSIEEEWEELKSWPWRLYRMMNVVEEYASGGTISSLSTTLQAGFPLVNYTGVTWGSRFPCLWLLPGLYMDVDSVGEVYPYHPPEGWGELEQYIVDSVVDDLREYQPDLLIVDDFIPGVTMNGFDYLEYFGQDPRFRRLFSAYQPLVRIDNYRIYRRVSRSEPS